MKKTMSKNYKAEPIICFNGKECSYETCPLYQRKLDVCRLDMLKELLQEPIPQPTNQIRETAGSGDKVLPPFMGGELVRLIKKEGLPMDIEVSDDATRVEPTKFLGDRWNDLMDFLGEKGYEWVSAGKDSHWKYTGEKEDKQKQVEEEDRGRQKSITEKTEFNVGDFVSVTGTLTNPPEQREVNTRRGPTTVTNFDLDVDGVIVRAGLWGELGDQAVMLNEGDEVTLTSMHVKEPYQDKTQLSSTKNTELTRH